LDLEFLDKLETPESCEQYAKNVESRSPEQAAAARAKRIRLLAAKHGGDEAVVQEGYQAVYAFENASSKEKNRKVRASRTWQMVAKVGMVRAIEHIVSMRGESQGFRSLAELGLLDFAFEAVVLRHPSHFSVEAQTQANARLTSFSEALSPATRSLLS
jgi:hypothetical protein